MEAESIQKVAVLGLGTMGHGIAQIFATADCRVHCFNNQVAARESLHQRIGANRKDRVKADLMDQCEIEPILDRIMVMDTE